MNNRPIRIGIGGSHSTGKTTFLTKLKERIQDKNLSVCHIQNLASNAQELGFPILTEHTYESTLWIMAEGLRRETEATLSSNVLLVDRPVFDALGYFEAALEISGRKAEVRQLEELRIIAKAHIGAYKCVIGTELDQSILLAKGRDNNESFRLSAAYHIKKFLDQDGSGALTLTSANGDEILDHVEDVIKEHFSIASQVDM